MDRLTTRRSFFRSRRQLRGRRNQGTTMVETALMLPFLLIFFLALVDFGFYFQSYFAARNAARVGARVASIFQLNCQPSQLANDVNDRVQKVIAAATLPYDPTVTVSFSRPTGASGLCGNDPDRLVAVQVKFPYRLHYLEKFFGDITFNADLPVIATDMQRDFNRP